MSTLSVGTIKSNTSAPPVIQNTSGTEIGTFCRAFVNFNGTGTVAIRASFNVSSITDNGTGNYTVNFTTAMPDANYAVAKSAEDNGTYFNSRLSSLSNRTASSIQTYVENSSGVATDINTINVAVFR